MTATQRPQRGGVSAKPDYADALVSALKDSGVGIVAALPESLMIRAFRLLERDPEIRYVPVASESELPGIAAGAYFGGKRAVIIMENSGIRQGCEPLARLRFGHGIPMVMIMPYRGDLGEPNWWGHAHAVTMEPLLKALRIPYFFVSRLEDIGPSIKKAFIHANSGQIPVALIFRGACVEGGHAAD